MKIEIITRFSPTTYSARAVGYSVKATATSGHDWAAQAVANKLLKMFFMEMKNPVISSLSKVSDPKNYTDPIHWNLILKEAA